MPKIPAPNLPTVTPQKAPGIAMPSAPAGAFGEQAAAGLANLGQSLGQVAIEAQHQANLTRVEDVNNQLRSKQMDIVKFVQQQRGKNAFDPKAFGGQDGQSLEEVAAGMFDATASGLDQDLGNEVQRQMFRQARDRFRLDLQGQVQGHVAQQTQVAQADEFKGRQEVELQNVGLNGYVNGKLDQPTVNLSLNRSLAAVDLYADTQGWSDDQRQAAKREVFARVYGTVIDRMMNPGDGTAPNIDGAKAVFQMHEKDMDPAMMAGIRKKIDETTNSIQVLKDVNELAATGKSMEEQYLELTKRYAGRPHLLQEARIELQNRYTMHKESQAIQKQETEGKLWGMFSPTLPGQQKVPLWKIKQSPEWVQYGTDTDRNILLKKWEEFGKRDENDPFTRANQLLRYYNVITERDKDGKLVYPTLTDNQIRAHMGDLGPIVTQQLIKDIYEYRTTPGKVKKVTIDQDLLHAEAKKYGLIKGDKPTDSEKMALSVLESQLKVMQQNSGQDWSYENTQRLIRTLVTPIIVDRENWFQRNLIPGDWNTTKHLFELQQTEQIPQPFIDSISAKLKAKGITTPMSRADMYQLYFDYKNQGKLDQTGKINE